MDHGAALGVLELGTHENQLTDFCTVAGSWLDVTVFASQSVHDRVRGAVDTDVEWVTQDPEESRRTFLSRVEDRSRSLDALWSFPVYGTVVDYLHYARFDPACPFLLSAYDTNGWVGRNPVVTPKLYNFLKFPLRRRLLDRVDTLVVEFEPIADRVRDHLPVPVRPFTAVVHDESTQRTGESGDELTRQTDETDGADRSDRFVVTVPGMIDRTRRSYHDLLDAFADRQPREDVELVLLGRPVGSYGSEILDRCASLRAAGWRVTTFEEWVPTEAFDAQLARTDLLASPLCRSRTVDGFREFYGRTKGSGVVGDAIRRALPLALPDWYDVPDRVTPATLSYADETELLETVTELAADRRRRDHLRETAHSVAAAYAEQAQRERLADVLRTATT